MQRRDLLKLSAASLSMLSLPSLARPNLPAKIANKKFVWVLLRGGMDGLHATVPWFDPDLLKLRSELLEPLKGNTLPLARDFGLHPGLKFLHELYAKKQLNAIVATTTPYRHRSHFDAQDALESGLPSIDHDSGWMARMLSELNSHNGSENSNSNKHGLAVARSLPVAMRGNNDAMTWYPSKLSETNDDLHQRLMQLYENDDGLSMRLEQALETQKLVGQMSESKRSGKLVELAQSCATLLKEPNGPTVAMLEMNGWDTHNRQTNRLRSKFKTLDKGIKALHDSLGEQWDDTVVIIGTEFGRTAKMNGTSGTDHGTATSMFITGGAVNGGQVLGEWPGLARDKLYEKRDLQPTSNTFSWMASALSQHWQLDSQQTARIFPETETYNTKLIKKA